MCTVVFLKETKWHQFLAKPDKIKFLNEPKQTEQAKQKHGVDTMHTNICVTFDTSFPTVKQLSSIMTFGNISVKQNRLESQN